MGNVAIGKAIHDKQRWQKKNNLIWIFLINFVFASIIIKHWKCCTKPPKFKFHRFSCQLCHCGRHKRAETAKGGKRQEQNLIGPSTKPAHFCNVSKLTVGSRVKDGFTRQAEEETYLQSPFRFEAEVVADDSNFIKIKILAAMEGCFRKTAAAPSSLIFIG